MITNILAFLCLAHSPEVDIVYSKIAGDDIKMDIYMPSDNSRAHPGIVLIHGGAWVSGGKKDMNEMAAALAAGGFVVANTDYRLAPKSKWPAQLDDCQAAVRYLRANATKFHVDPKRVGAVGASAGAHLAIFLGSIETRATKDVENSGFSSKVQAVLDFFGPTDLTRDFPKFIADSISKQVLGKPYDAADPDVKRVSPFYGIDKNSAPIFIYQGLADPLVNPNQSRILEAKYKELGIAVESRYLEKVGHEIALSKPGVKEAVADAMVFLKKHLGN